MAKFLIYAASYRGINIILHRRDAECNINVVVKNGRNYHPPDYHSRTQQK